MTVYLRDGSRVKAHPTTNFLFVVQDGKLVVRFVAADNGVRSQVDADAVDMIA